MNNTEVKNFLRRFKNLDENLIDCDEQYKKYERFFDNATSISSVMSDEPHSTVKHDKIADNAVEMADLSIQIKNVVQKRKLELELKKLERDYVLEPLNSQQRSIINDLFFRDKSYYSVAEKNGYTHAYIYNVTRGILRIIGKRIENLKKESR